MKKILSLLLFTSHFLIAQRNIALLNVVPNSSNTALAASVDFSEIPFELAGGMVVVQASINGEMGNFILDTGAPGIVLNTQNDEILKAANASSVSGDMKVGEVLVQDFQLGIIKIKKTQGHVLNVHHLETACGMNIMGLIGFDVLRNYELLFDFPNNKIQAFKSGKAVHENCADPKFTFSFVLCGHVPVFMAKVGNKRAFLGLDSGAEINLINLDYYKRINASNFSNVQTELLTGLDNMPNEVIAADVKNTRIKGEQLPEMRYVFADLSRLRNELNTPLDGLLGVPFFKDRVISIDYGRKKIRIWQ
ncbi:MAG: hypothetical protein GC192_06370 [Bacteroidetes bacterium]|nr:hypothetical protein [Bacteroidota bacterium]